MCTEDGGCSGRPKEIVTDENILKIYKMILNDRKLKLNEIAHTLNISIEREHHIISEYLGMRKLCSNYLEKGSTINSDYYMALLDRLKDEIAEKGNFKKKEMLLHQDNAPSGPQRLLPIPDLKRMLTVTEFSSNEEMIAEIEAYFEAKHKS
ncbi:hypothetical protein GWI33_020444 [Rhynchophorus ferrugineus]|uniref:Uncharacterized protein n=1 Tax=Rhynchophorus ferrugineus TaxID=354439 RepID=A0A834HUD0_RHYFE|nr:hypothetical protein GWI33_020444 [Rhynchophorus ferrugineus]